MSSSVEEGIAEAVSDLAADMMQQDEASSSPLQGVDDRSKNVIRRARELLAQACKQLDEEEENVHAQLQQGTPLLPNKPRVGGCFSLQPRSLTLLDMLVCG